MDLIFFFLVEFMFSVFDLMVVLKVRHMIGVTGFRGVVGFSVGFRMKNSCGQRGYMVRTGSGSDL